MTTLDDLNAFVARQGWRWVRHADLGTTAHIAVVDTGERQVALKVQRAGISGDGTLAREYRVLQALAASPMRHSVPEVGAWYPELGGFAMEMLREPTAADWSTIDWAAELASVLRILHSLRLPSIPGLEDDRPAIGAALADRYGRRFRTVLEDDAAWVGLSAEDRRHLALVRARYPAHAELLPALEVQLSAAAVALTHGDLAFDNVMLTPAGHVALIDWGEACITTPLADVAHLITYAPWSEDRAQRFLDLYFNGDQEELARALPAVRLLLRLTRYRSCVQSLCWLNELGPEGLDAVGRAHFERQLHALQCSAN